MLLLFIKYGESGIAALAAAKLETAKLDLCVYGWHTHNTHSQYLPQSAAKRHEKQHGSEVGDETAIQSTHKIISNIAARFDHFNGD